jgi:hypothetical protein
MQSKGHQGKRPDQKHFNDSEENTKGGYSRSARFEVPDLRKMIMDFQEQKN